MASAEATASSDVALGADSLVGSEGVRALGQTLGGCVCGYGCVYVAIWVHACVCYTRVCRRVCFCLSLSLSLCVCVCVHVAHTHRVDTDPLTDDNLLSIIKPSYPHHS